MPPLQKLVLGLHGAHVDPAHHIVDGPICQQGNSHQTRLDCADELEEVLRREKEAGITPDPELDAFMKAEMRTGKRESIVTDLIIKMLGLDVSKPAQCTTPHAHCT